MGDCTMCGQAPATTIWGFPVCQPCAESLHHTDAELEAMEADDADLAELAQQAEEAWERYQAEGPGHG